MNGLAIVDLLEFIVNQLAVSFGLYKNESLGLNIGQDFQQSTHLMYLRDKFNHLFDIGIFRIVHHANLNMIGIIQMFFCQSLYFIGPCSTEHQSV